MFYQTGQIVKLGDKVKLWSDCYGVVVCSIDTNEFSDEYPAPDWAYLKTGVLIMSNKGGLIHYLKNDEDLELIERASIA
jgi:hypothetical protein